MIESFFKNPLPGGTQAVSCIRGLFSLNLVFIGGQILMFMCSGCFSYTSHLFCLLCDNNFYF